MKLPPIDFTFNNLFWIIVGAIIGVIFTSIWTKYRERKKIFANIFCQRDYKDNCFYLYIYITNEGSLSLPKLSVKLKNSSMGNADFYFDELSTIDEIKPFQHSSFRIKITDEKLNLIEKWDLFLNDTYYDSYIKISAQSSSTPIKYSHDFALRTIAQLLYYQDNNFETKKDWKWLKKRQKKIYLKKVKNKIPISTRLALWNRFPVHYRINHYHKNKI